MRFNPKSKIEGACKRSETRYAMTSVLLRADARVAELVATDGLILAIVPCELDEGEHVPHGDANPLLLPPEALAEARKQRAKSQPNAHLAINGKTAKCLNGAEFPYREGAFPRVDDVLPSGVPVVKVGLDVGLLKRLADAISTDGKLTMEFHGPHAPVKATGDLGTGVCMPFNTRK